MKTYILDASKIDPDLTAEEFFCTFYSLEAMSMQDIRKYFFNNPEPVVTEVFSWPVKTPNWKEISMNLESMQQHSPYFYVIWGPETLNARTYEIGLHDQEAEAADRKQIQA